MGTRKHSPKPKKLARLRLNKTSHCVQFSDGSLLIKRHINIIGMFILMCFIMPSFFIVFMAIFSDILADTLYDKSLFGQVLCYIIMALLVSWPFLVAFIFSLMTRVYFDATAHTVKIGFKKRLSFSQTDIAAPVTTGFLNIVRIKPNGNRQNLHTIAIDESELLRQWFRGAGFH